MTRHLRTVALAIMIPALILTTATPSRAMYASFKAGLARVPQLLFGLMPASEPPKRLPANRKLTRDEIWKVVQNESARQKVSAELVWGLIAASSNFNQDARSPSGAIGLMQLMPGTASDLKLSRIEEPERNISGGVTYLKVLLDQYGGDAPRAIAAYRFGPASVHKAEKLPDWMENFVSSVLQHGKNSRRS